ncbi:hypothetical protein BH10ACT5_BH10ACT5_12920 [soil metagenome]
MRSAADVWHNRTGVNEDARMFSDPRGLTMPAQGGGTKPQTGAIAVVADATDPARRPDVLFRVRRADDHQVSAWWMIGAFVAVSVAVIALLSFVPGGA